MICNSELTIYHKGFDKSAKMETWTRYNYDNVWFFGGKGAFVNKGYDNANDVEVRIPYDKNEVDINNIEIGDILVKGKLTTNITRQQDLKDYEIYNITMIKNNTFGNTPHIHLGGK